MDRPPKPSSPDSARRPPAGDPAQTAADWVVRRDGGLTPQEHRALLDWEGAATRHAAELARMERAWRSLDGLAGVAELEAMADAVVSRARARRRSRSLRLVATACAAAAAVAVAFLGWRNPRPESTVLLDTADKNYRVLASSLQRMTLPDGSIAELNGASRIEVDYTPAARHVSLIEGEVHFIVAKNAERPFVVSAGTVTVRAVGTAFNVRLASEVIEVLVTEGKVKLEPAASRPLAPSAPIEATSTAAESPPAREDSSGPALVAGQRAVIRRAEGATAASASVGDVGRAGIDEALGWQSTRLAFNNTPLSEVVEGFNRRNTHRLTIGDPAIRDRTLTGVFRADNVEGFARLLRHSIDVKAELRTPTETVLLPVR